MELWRTAIMKPSQGQAGPVPALAATMFGGLPELSDGDFPNAAALADHLRRGGMAAGRPITGALARASAAAQRQRHADAPLHPALVVLIDQLEELLRRPSMTMNVRPLQRRSNNCWRPAKSGALQPCEPDVDPTAIDQTDPGQTATAQHVT